MALIFKKMKRFIYIIACLAATVMMASSCEKETVEVSNVDHAVAGVWHLSSSTAEGSPINQYDVYLYLAPEGNFELYQKSGSQSRYDKYTGTFTTQEGIINGVYSDGRPWGSKYTYTVTDQALVLKSFNLIEEQKYQRSELPEDVIDNANAVVTKSEGNTPIL